ncbi:putative phage baseplate assembly protein [Nocardia tenerifensis]|uniref:Putative phage baseplate assembly protein n=1 Tax=Nocardia tenerifensis TaxID=228006 RepID=A0A318JUP1_9NOCA|nr:putative baseplate assembly protein [Nocardia tenerifensis]PXX60814.1 putative phage baseplate assembly protein [Nocardia tenerifensis]
MNTGCGSGCADTGCGCDNCCTGITVATPVSVANRPGLPTLTYRVGTHPQFLASMRARLGSAELPALAGLTTRDPGDLSLALLDGWATLADVLTFYTERIANEGFLRTATEEYSVRRLAELVGYQPRPGLSASAYLAFTVNPNQRVPIPAGTKAQQIPGPGQLPATFETAEPVVGYGNLSAMTVRRRQPQLLNSRTLWGTKNLTFKGTLTDLRVGDRIVAQLAEKNVLVVFDVTGVVVDAPADLTAVEVCASHYRNLAAALRRAAPVVAEAVQVSEAREDRTRLELLVKGLRKPASVPPADAADLKRDLRDLLGADKAGVTALLGDLVPEVAGTLDAALAHSAADDDETPKITRMRQSAMLFGATAPKFPRYEGGEIKGYVDPKLTKLGVRPESTSSGAVHVGEAEPKDVDEDHPTIQPPDYKSGTTLDLDAVYPAITAGSQIVLINPVLGAKAVPNKVTAVETVTANILGLSTKVSRLTLENAWPPGGGTKPLHDVLDNTTVLGYPEDLVPAGISLDDKDIGCPPAEYFAAASSEVGSDADSSCDTVELDGLFPELTPGRWLILTGERTDAAIKAGQVRGHDGRGPTGVPGSELVMVAAVEHHSKRIVVCQCGGGKLNGGCTCEVVELPGDTVHTFVRFSAPLAYTYLRSSVILYGNVAPATHGETRDEVLGSGDPTKEFARYPLKQPPLTYLPAPTSAGASAALEVFVDGVRWHEADSLLDIGRDDRRYVIETDDDGNTAVVFGAARPPTGIENIRARYRSGIGLSGNAAAGSIATPLDQPLGVTAVTNPQPATGGADRDRRETVRRNAAVSVQALDRLVSVSDYADFAVAFAGVGAAAARELSDGRRLVVHVTVAGIDDAPIAPTSALAANLRQALRNLGDPDQEVQVAIRTLRALAVSARVRIDPDRVWAEVEPAIRARLLAVFGPGKREIAQPITQSAVLAEIQAVPGVVYADLRILDSLGETELVSEDPTAGLSLLPVVPAAPAAFDRGGPRGLGRIRPAELLILSPTAPDTLILEAI